MQAQYKKTVCPLDCPDSCGMIAKVIDGRVISLTGDPDHPYTRGFICRKMRSYHKRLYSRDRILYPQLRTGGKGEGRFRRIGWPEAMAVLAEKIREVIAKHGPEAILPFQYAGNMGVINRNAGYGLYNKIGVSRLNETICSTAAGRGWSLHYDNVPGSPPEMAADADLILAWGINVKVTNVHFWPYITAARKRGARLIVIDPYHNDTAKAADRHLQVLPGGDGALALGTIKALLEKGALNEELPAEQTTGFADLADYLEHTPWSAFTTQSGLLQDQIEEFAKLLATHPKAFIRIGMGLSRNSRGGMSVRSIISLAAALGLFGGGDGKGVLLTSKAFTGDISKLRFPELAGAPARLINMAHLGHALTALEPAVHLFIVYNSNPASVAPDSSMVRRGLAREDLFTVVHEQVMTPTARFADLLLPATTFLENRDLYMAYGHFYLGAVDPVIAPVGEARSNFDLFQTLAKEMGYTDAPFQQTLDERLSSYMATIRGLPDGFSFDSGSTTNWICSSRRRTSLSVLQQFGVSFAFRAKTEPGIPPFPCLLAADEFASRELLSRFPLRLITPPHRDLLNSTFGEGQQNRPGEVLIHPEDARLYGLTDGAEVILYNHRGKTLRIARLSKDTRRGLVVAEGIFWQENGDWGGINDLTSQNTTDIGEGPTFHESLVAISELKPTE